MYNIGVFISHSWSHSGHYDKLAEWIWQPNGWSVKDKKINFINYSIPENNPIHNVPNASTLERAINREIYKAHVFICPTGMYSTHSYWIAKELRGASQSEKKVLAVNPWGQERKSSVVIRKSHHSVGWTKQGVVDGIWKLFLDFSNGR